ncbi:hypothetical protein Hanom_Chr12g01095501 [Helianthus anomalus]
MPLKFSLKVTTFSAKYKAFIFFTLFFTKNHIIAALFCVFLVKKHTTPENPQNINDQKQEFCSTERERIKNSSTKRVF